MVMDGAEEVGDGPKNRKTDVCKSMCPVHEWYHLKFGEALE